MRRHPTRRTRSRPLPSPPAPPGAGALKPVALRTRRGGSDSDGDPLTYVPTTGTTGKGGTFTVNPDGTYTYTPSATARHDAAANGATAADKSDTFTVTVSDGHGGSVAMPVTVTVAPANAVPLSSSPTVGTPNPTTGDVAGTARVTDLDGDQLTYTASTPSRGTVVIDAATGSYTYTPTEQARFQAAVTPATDLDEFIILVDDGHGGVLAVPVTVVVAPTAFDEPTSVATLPIGRIPAPVVFSPDGTRGYVAGRFSDGTLTVLDAAKNSVIATIPVARSIDPRVVFSPNGRHAYVFDNEGEGIVTVISTTSDTVVATFEADTHHVKPFSSPDGTRTFFLDRNTGKLQMVDSVNDLVSTIDVGNYPHFPIVTQDGRRVYIPDFQNQTLVVVDTAEGTVLATIHTDGMVNPPVFSPDGRRAYVNNPNTETLVVIDTVLNEQIGSVSVGYRASSVQFDPDGSRAYVVSYDQGTVQMIDPREDTVVGTIDVGYQARELQFSPDGTRAYVTSYGAGRVVMIDTVADAVLGTVPVATTERLQFSADGKTAFIKSYTWGSDTSETITLVDVQSGDVLATVPVGAEPNDLKFVGGGSRFILSSRDGTVTIGSATSGAVLSTIDVGESAADVQISPDEDRAYVIDYEGQRLVVIDTTTNSVVKTFSDFGGSLLQFSPDGRYAYVLRSDQRDVLVVLDTKTDEATELAVPYNPGWLTFSPSGEYAAYAAPDGVTFVAAGKQVTTVPVDSPGSITFSSDGRYAYVAGFEGTLVSVYLPPTDSASTPSEPTLV